MRAHRADRRPVRAGIRGRSAAEQSDDGVFYAETYFTAPREMDVLVAVQGSVAVWVDDALVLERSLRTFGSWQRFGAAMHVQAGRHRLLARLIADASTLRILNLDGTPADVATDVDPRAPYATVPPRPLADRNPIAAIVRARAAASPLQALLASWVAHVEAMDDVAAALIEPYVKDNDAAPVALELAAQYAHADPAYPEDVRRRNERALRTRAVTVRKPGLGQVGAWLPVAPMPA